MAHGHKSQSADTRTSTTYRVEIRHGFTAMEDLREAWQTLLTSIAGGLPTQSYEYVLAYRSAFAHNWQSHYLCLIYRESALVGIIPVRYLNRRVKGVPLRVLVFVDLPMPIRDILLSPHENPTDLWSAVCAQFTPQTGKIWDYWHFRSTPATSPLISNAIPRCINFKHGLSNAIDVAGHGYLKTGINSNARNNLKRNQKKLQQAGTTHYRSVTALPDLMQAYEHFLDTEAAGWKSVSGGKRAVKLHQDQTEFYRHLMLLKAQSGEAHIHLLELDGRPIASDYCIVVNDVVYSLKHGYDEAFKKYAPGNLLRAYTIEYYEQSEIKTLDLVSSWSWHARWKPTARPIYDVKVFGIGPKARLLYTLFRLLHALR